MPIRQVASPEMLHAEYQLNCDERKRLQEGIKTISFTALTLCAIAFAGGIFADPVKSKVILVPAGAFGIAATIYLWWMQIHYIDMLDDIELRIQAWRQSQWLPDITTQNKFFFNYHTMTSLLFSTILSGWFYVALWLIIGQIMSLALTVVVVLVSCSVTFIPARKKAQEQYQKFAPEREIERV